jgi:hypothetical protein
MGPLAALLCLEHGRIEADLRAAASDPARFDSTSFEAARVALLRHIAVEEKILLPFARRRQGAPLAIAARLRKEHGAIASLLVPTPDAALVGELLALLAAHDALEEGPGGVYEQVEALAGAELDELLERARALPAPPPAPHFDGHGTVRTAAAALRAHGLDPGA